MSRKYSLLKTTALSLVLALAGIQALHAADAGKDKNVVASAATAEAARAKALLQKGVDYFKEKGDAALVAFGGKAEFLDHDLYIYVVSTGGRMLASGGPSSDLLGMDVTKMKDANGKAFFKEMLDKAKTDETGQVEYRWINPADKNKVERKVALFQKVGTRIIAVGYYIPRATPEQAKGLLDKAVTAVEADPKKAFAEFNKFNSSFKQDDLYVFALDTKDGSFLAHGATPKLVGTKALSLQDDQGKAVAAEIIDIAKAKGQGELEYVWRNPVTEKVEYKHAFFRKVGDVVVAVGYYFVR